MRTTGLFFKLRQRQQILSVHRGSLDVRVTCEGRTYRGAGSR
jgi:hypothetical protein